MNLAQLMWKMWRLRCDKPQRFDFYTTMYGPQEFTVFYRKSVIKVTICADSDIYEQWLEVVYADQNPHGKSAEAELVRSGAYQPRDVGWLYISQLNERRLWLGKIVGGRPIPFKVGEFDPRTRTMNLSL